ncbi:hypothetical protein [Paraburkholderia pallida]|uniref:hypothetical protein n=1 Tax=Paraburkholderia pallida TaxID=2547399 RepID=UPI00142FC95D|nr:hypothetical protein [Paraburkholderia pallida]
MAACTSEAGSHMGREWRNEADFRYCMILMAGACREARNNRRVRLVEKPLSLAGRHPFPREARYPVLRVHHTPFHSNSCADDFFIRFSGTDFIGEMQR